MSLKKWMVIVVMLAGCVSSVHASNSKPKAKKRRRIFSPFRRSPRPTSSIQDLPEQGEIVFFDTDNTSPSQNDSSVSPQAIAIANRRADRMRRKPEIKWMTIEEMEAKEEREREEDINDMIINSEEPSIHLYEYQSFESPFSRKPAYKKNSYGVNSPSNSSIVSSGSITATEGSSVEPIESDIDELINYWEEKK